jgi:hypothetical protein
VVVAAGLLAVFADGRAAELAAPSDEGVVEQAAGATREAPARRKPFASHGVESPSLGARALRRISVVLVGTGIKWAHL